jgi:hypothetical protein
MSLDPQRLANLYENVKCFDRKFIKNVHEFSCSSGSLTKWLFFYLQKLHEVLLTYISQTIEGNNYFYNFFFKTLRIFIQIC